MQGKYFDGDEWNGTYDAWQSTVQTNLYSALLCSKFACEYFLQKKSGVIINIASKYGITGQFDSIVYGASKAGIINITKAYAKKMAPYIRVNCISPGAIKAGYWLTEDALNYIDEEIKQVPMGEFVEINDIVEAILFLASDQAKMITGQNLVVDGGYTLK